MKRKAGTDERRAWLYARVSTRKKSQEQSPAAQLERLGEVARLKGWSVVGKGFDRASSVKTADLVELARGLRALQTGAANVLMVTDLDRLGGDLRSILDTAKLIGDLGANLFIESYQIDTTQGGPIGKFFFHTLAAFVELRRTLQNDKIARGVASARARGRRIGRPQKHYPTQALLARAIKVRKGPPVVGWRELVRLLRAEGWKEVPSHPTLRRWILKPPIKLAPGGHKHASATPSAAPADPGRKVPPKRPSVAN